MARLRSRLSCSPKQDARRLRFTTGAAGVGGGATSLARRFTIVLVLKYINPRLSNRFRVVNIEKSRNCQDVRVDRVWRHSSYYISAEGTPGLRWTPWAP